MRYSVERPIFSRRATSDIPVYRLALRSYMGELVANKANLGWSIEGGRTRTGKLRPPRYGLLRYVADAPYAEISAVMDTTEEAARRNVHEGLKRLRLEYQP